MKVPMDSKIQFAIPKSLTVAELSGLKPHF